MYNSTTHIYRSFVSQGLRGFPVRVPSSREMMRDGGHGENNDRVGVVAEFCCLLHCCVSGMAILVMIYIRPTVVYRRVLLLLLYLVTFKQQLQLEKLLLLYSVAL